MLAGFWNCVCGCGKTFHARSSTMCLRRCLASTSTTAFPCSAHFSLLRWPFPRTCASHPNMSIPAPIASAQGNHDSSSHDSLPESFPSAQHTSPAVPPNARTVPFESNFNLGRPLRDTTLIVRQPVVYRVSISSTDLLVVICKRTTYARTANGTTDGALAICLNVS
ncbi:hypothetical protein BCR44DRAFT_1258994 [Catenaria anguillulae PL171]|uniref:Uncharacterized protein n=1 Tax=Catenaria anguillulae PL171 TaxID=765915 RepID=A0A1Y2HB86_9FUNG|nr:hypothetical protein BCR44DRAFT_1258994 [Catenaria anguillulae PL171]